MPDLRTVNCHETLLHGLAPLAKLSFDQIRDRIAVVRQHIGLGRGVGTLLLGIALGHIGHESVHVGEVALIVSARMCRKPGLAFLGHIVLGIAQIAHDQIVPAFKIVQELGMRHPGLLRNIPQGDLRHGLFLDAALKGHQDLHPDGFFINDQRHRNPSLSGEL